MIDRGPQSRSAGTLHQAFDVERPAQPAGLPRGGGEGAFMAMQTAHCFCCAASPDRSVCSIASGIAGSIVSSKARTGHAEAAVVCGQIHLQGTHDTGVGLPDTTMHTHRG